MDWTSKHGWTSRNHLAKADSTLQFREQFQLNILPGDLAIIEGFTWQLQHDLGPSDFHYLSEVATLLFKVVVMRGYLGRNPCDDEQIFYLACNPSSFGEKLIALPDDPLLEAKHGSIVRNLTVPERVLSGSKSSHNLHRLVTNNVPFPQDFQLAEVLDASGQPYQFFRTTSTGLFAPGNFLPFRPLKYISSPDHASKPAAISWTTHPPHSKPRVIMENYQPSHQLKYTPSPDHLNKPAIEPPNHPLREPVPLGPVPSGKQAKRRRSGDDDDYFAQQPADQLKSMSKKDKRQRNDEDHSVPPRRSSRLNK